MASYHGRAERVGDGSPDRAEEDDPEYCAEADLQRRLDNPIAQLAQVPHDRHPAFRVGLP